MRTEQEIVDKLHELDVKEMELMNDDTIDAENYGFEMLRIVHYRTALNWVLNGLNSIY